MKIYISYKHNDQSIKSLVDKNQSNKKPNILNPAKNYVEKITELLRERYIIGEQIYNSDITIILVSPTMKEIGIEENDQWMPLEINFSLKKPNAMLAIALPDRDNKYNYFMNYCSDCGSISLESKILFKIMNENMFNLKNSKKNLCMGCKKTIHFDEDISYISCIKWDYFIKNPDKYIHRSLQIRNNIGNYNITLTI